MKRSDHPSRTSQLLLLALILLTFLTILRAQSVRASGFGVFTQGASGLGQANAVVAHPTGPSSLYFNPALLNDLPGRQVEVGTTAVLAKRKISLESGGSESTGDIWNFPTSLYYTHQANDRVVSGFGVTFPFGLSNSWDSDAEGRYLGTSAEMLTMNLNPVIAYRATDKLSVAFGLDLLYLDTEFEAMINQTVVGGLLPELLGGPLTEMLPDVKQTFTGTGWGHGFNLGVLYKPTKKLSFGAAYRSHIDIEISDGEVDYASVDPRLTLLFPEGSGGSEIRLPAQFTAGIAVQATEQLIVEAGFRWEDWDSTNQLEINLDEPFLGQSNQVIPRDWHATWAWNLGGQFRVNDRFALNAGYLYADDPVPDATFEPVIPDSPAHLLTIGADMTFGAWTLSAAFGYEYHESRDKTNDLGDPLGSMAAGQPVGTAKGEYSTDIYLVGVSVGYRF